MKRLILPALALLAACGTPQEQCISYNTRDLRVVDRLIAESEGNLERGYAYEKVTEYEEYWTWCRSPVEGDPPRMCLQERTKIVDRPKAIDLGAEAAKLDSLKAKHKDLARKAEAVIAQCKAEHPE